MKLFYDPVSTTSRPVLLMLAEAQIDAELEIVSILSGDQHAPAFRAVNPKGLVPALEVEPGFVLTEADAILRYLARHRAPHLYPDEPRTRARVDEMMSWFGTDVHLLLDFCTVYPHTLLRDALPAGTAAALTAFAEPRLRAALDHLNRVLDAYPHAAGETMTIADLLGYSYVSLAELVAFDFSPWPAVGRWLARMRALPGRDGAFAAFDAVATAVRMGRMP